MSLWLFWQPVVVYFELWLYFNPFSVYPGTVSGSTTRSHSVYPVTVTLLQLAINIHSLILLHIVCVVSLRP